MRVLSIEERPFYEVAYKCAAPGGGRSEQRVLPLFRGVVESLPVPLEALVVTSDLQGVSRCPEREGVISLLGESVARELARISRDGELPPAANIGVILAGDLYSEPFAKRRGASGDVRGVWDAFADRFRWVAGVAGNHDIFGDPSEQRAFANTRNINLLDGQTLDLDGLRVGGVSGIIGRSQKLGRKPPEDFLHSLGIVLEANPDLLVLHEGPNGPETGQLGSDLIRDRLDGRDQPLVVCGHSHWNEPLATLTGGAQVLNVDARVIVLCPGHTGR